jgi:glycosyltransferase involved in cell wall biosynthesis
MISNIKIKYVITRNDNYLKNLNKFKIRKNQFKKNENPKISIITPIYNRELYLIRFLRCIQQQTFQDIEIIFVDDCSSDKGVKIIEENKKDDERIILIKNKKNKGTFVTRNLGVLYAKGKYLIIPDPDDILNNNILTICYEYAEKYNYEIIRFNIQKENNIVFDNISKKLQNTQLHQPEISTILFYLKNELEKTDCFIYNKFIRTEVYIKALNILSDLYLKIHMRLNEDQLINYVLHRTAKSFYFLKTIGYYYISNKISITKNVFKCGKELLKCYFIYLKIIFEHSKNEKYEKDMFNFFVNNLFRNYCISTTYSLLTKEEYNFYFNLINIFLNNKFITNENKNLFKFYLKTLKKKFK